MQDLLVHTISCLLDSQSQQGLAWSSVAIEPRVAPAAVNLLWRYPHMTRALRIANSGDVADGEAVRRAAASLRAAVQADSYQLVLLGSAAGAAQELDQVVIGRAERRGARKRLALLLGSRGGWLAPLTAEAVADGIIRKLTAYAGLSLEIAAPELDATLLDWRALFDADEQASLGVADAPESRRWVNLAALAAKLGVTPIRVGDALAAIPQRQAQLIRLRFGIGRMGEAVAAESAAAILQIDPARFAQIEAAALAALRETLARQTRLLFRS